ncbi:DUF1638 domain-containing protein [Eubacterium barkeri]|uniref:DUF1638 domain-containing protein n=1 Tax=Eubacterium barkeri TaxID=1528 RepID=A0A1H3EX56_EUBBA|nr:DUF1638 domain-containing protein [Eubacterium barkeri]SDX83311.1 Protein of unknown function [Eubacterium barkeri]
MKKVIIGCSVLRREIEVALGSREDFVCIWLEDQLHNVPETLHQKVQAAIDAAWDAEVIYLLYGHCGRALNGVRARHCPLVLPRVEDCIDVMLYGNPSVSDLRRTSYFVSQGWLWGEEGLGYEYDRMKAARGEKRALRMVQAMYRNYKYIQFLSTGVETPEDRKKCAHIAAVLGLELSELPGSVTLLTDMLDGAEDDRFIRVLPDGEIVEEMFRRLD